MNGRLLYINLDGLGAYYLQTPDAERRFPALHRLMRSGVFFENAYTGIPSITYPMQCAIVSGCYSAGTGNCDKYYDRAQNAIVPLRRYNRAQTVGELLREQNIPFVSIQQFALENRGAQRDDPRALYVQPGGDYAVRFALLLELLTQGTLTLKEKTWRFDEAPRAVFFYADDLDSVGHNPEGLAATEEARVENVRARLEAIDRMLARVLDILQAQGDWTLLLCTDHGMISCQGESRIPELVQALRAFSLSRVAVHTVGPLPEADFDALLTSHDIQCQVFFGRGGVQQDALKNRMLALPFVDQVLTSAELRARGVCPQYADMVVSPVEGAHFSTEHAYLSTLHATHDSLHEKCQHIFAAIQGPGVRSGLRVAQRVQNIDFLPALCERLGVGSLRDAACAPLPDVWR